MEPPAARPPKPVALPRRILMTADTVGGIWTYAIELCTGLTEAGVQVTLATMGAPLSAAQCADAANIRGLTIEESLFRLEWMDRAEDDVGQAGQWLITLEEKHRPDVIHLNGYAHGALPWRAPVLVVAHSCVHTWWQAVFGGSPPQLFDAYTHGLRRGVAGASMLVAPSSAYLDTFVRLHGEGAEHRVITNGRDPARFKRGPKENYFLSVGRLWDAAKNARALTEVAGQLPWPVRVAGDATSPDGRTVPLENVEVLGRCSPEMIAELLARAAVYVLPARYEPFGLSVLEAALSGCALVLGDIATLREIWGDAAVYVDPGNAEALRDTLVRLADDPELRRELGTRAFERAATYSTDAMTRGYLEAYAHILATHPGPAEQRATVFA